MKDDFILYDFNGNKEDDAIKKKELRIGECMIKYIKENYLIWCITIITLILVIVFANYAKKFSYHMWYKDMVKQQIIEMVNPECLK